MKLLPCTCGYNRRKLIHDVTGRCGPTSTILVCPKCGLGVIDFDIHAARRAWNAMIEAKTKEE